MFGDSQISPSKLPIKIPISTVHIIDICKALVEELRTACQVRMKDTDLNTLIIVSVLQAEAKVRIASRETAFHTFDRKLDSRVNKTTCSFPMAIFPLSVFLKQIGAVDIEGQTFVPELIDLKYETISKYASKKNVTIIPSNVIPLESGNCLTGAKQWVRILNESKALEIKIIERNEKGGFSFTQAFLRDPNKFNWIGVLFIEPPNNVVTDFEELAERYFDIIKRVREKLKPVVFTFDLYKSTGTAAQLATSKLHSSDENKTMYRVWCSRFIDDDSLEIGGYFHYGFGLEDSHFSRSSKFRCCEVFIETKQPLGLFVIKKINQCLIREMPNMES